MTLEHITREITDLHVDFEQWMCGRLETLDRVEAALAPDFLFVGTTASVLPRSGVLEFLRAGRGQTQIAMRIEDVELHWQRGDLSYATYVEVQEVAGAVTRRRSSAVLEQHSAGPIGLRWLSVHETWIDAPHE